MIVYGRGLDANNKQLYAACKKLVGKTLLARVMDISSYVGPDGSRFWHGDHEISDIDLCFLRSFGPGSCEQITRRISMMEHIESLGTFMINPTYAYLKARDKYSAIFTLARAGLPVPKTYITEMAHWAYRASQNFKQVVYKPIIGSLGFGSVKFSDLDLAFNAYKTLEGWGYPLYVQEYLEKPGRDIRAFVIRERVLAAIHRIAPSGEWKTNVAQGGKTQPIKLPKELEELALKAVETLDLIYAGVDILETEHGPILIEVNGAPSWQGLQKATGINVAESLVKSVMELAKR